MTRLSASDLTAVCKRDGGQERSVSNVVKAKYMHGKLIGVGAFVFIAKSFDLDPEQLHLWLHKLKLINDSLYANNFPVENLSSLFFVIF